MIARRAVALVLALLLLAAGCGGDDPRPPDRAASEQQIRQIVVTYNVLTAQGRGDEACAMLTEQARTRITGMFARDLEAQGVKDCASYWNWLGPRLPEQARVMMTGTQVSAVAVTGDHATATFATGGDVKLRWTGGRWMLD